MSGNEPFSDEHLNAFVDQQLDTEESARVFGALENDAGLRERVCQLQLLQGMVRQAYKNPPLPAPAGKNHYLAFRRRLVRFAAVGAALVIGAVTGWTAKGLLGDGATGSGFSGAHYTRLPDILDEGAGVIVHLDSANPKKLAAALDTTEQLLVAYKKTNAVAPVELIVNSGGLDLLRADRSPFAERISRMQKEYSNLTFFACVNAVERYKKKLGENARLLPGTKVDGSGVDQVVIRLRQGWSYLKI